jgi:hypothetical protein
LYPKKRRALKQAGQIARALKLISNLAGYVYTQMTGTIHPHSTNETLIWRSRWKKGGGVFHHGQARTVIEFLEKGNAQSSKVEGCFLIL